MVTKGEIQSIDYQGNTCIVRLPYFESAGIKDNIQAEATINNQPGMYNGYKAGDIVWVAFEDGEASQPVVIGKLYLGANKERNDPRGVVNAESSIISDNIQLPITTKIVYETDGTVAQNGITRYNTLSDITNELGKLSGKQSLTTVDMAGLITTANQIKAEVSSIKAQTGIKADYIQDTEPENPNYNEWASYKEFTSADQYVGFYINIGTEKQPSYIEITDENKEIWITNPGKKEAYKKQNLEKNNTWLYNGADLYEKITTPTSAKEFIGCYVYCIDGGSENAKLADKDPLTEKCPVSHRHSKTEPKIVYYAESGYKFTLVSSDNKAELFKDKDVTTISTISAYNIHLAKNTAFCVVSVEDNIVTWEETTLSYIKGFASSITQTDKSIDAKVSKKYNDGSAADFGWEILQSDDKDIDAAKEAYNKGDTTAAYTPGDEAGQFNIYSTITYKDKAAEKKNVFHANKNGVTINGNLEVQDSNKKTIFRALPYGQQVGDADDKGVVTYDGNPLVEIGTRKTIGEENSLWLSPTEGAESAVSIARSMKESDWRITSGKSFGVTKNGSLYSNDITIDGINMNAISNNDSDYRTINVIFDSSKNSFKVTLSDNAAADRSFLIKIYYKLSPQQSDAYFTEVILETGNSEAYSTPLLGIDTENISYSWTPQKISLRQGSFLNPNGFFDDRDFSHICGYRLPLVNNEYQIDSMKTNWYYSLDAKSAYEIGYAEDPSITATKPTGSIWGISGKTVKKNDIIYISWTQQMLLINGAASKNRTVTVYAVFQAFKDTTTTEQNNMTYDQLRSEILKFATEITPSTLSLETIYQKTYRSDSYIANKDRCVLYIPKDDFSSITSACITAEGSWSDIPLSLAICDIDNDSSTNYCLITVQATALKISSSTIVPATESDRFSTDSLYANVLCYGVDSFYTSGSILSALAEMTTTQFTTQLAEITNIYLENLPTGDTAYAVTVTLGSNYPYKTIQIQADNAFKDAGSLIELS